MAHVTRITAGKSKSKDEPEAAVTHKVKAGSKKSDKTTKDKNSKKVTKETKTTVKTIVEAEVKDSKKSETTKNSNKNSGKDSDKKDNKAKKGDEKKAKNTNKKSKNPFKAIGGYFSGSWHELRQVRWPSRKAAWKLVLAVFVYTALFMVLIMLLDALLTFVFNNILK